MLRRRHINADPRGRALRLAQAVADAVRWPFERGVWAVEQRLLWPLQRRFAGRGPSAGVAGGAALAVLAAAAIATGVFWPPGNGSHEQVAAPAPVAVVPPPPAATEMPQGAALHGAPPSFDVGAGAAVAKAAPDSSATAAKASGTEAEASGETPAGDETAATTSSAKPVPAGPEAMKVARRFSEAFVFYEVGERPARAKAAFGETATPELASALAERPPRLPRTPRCRRRGWSTSSPVRAKARRTRSASRCCASA